MKRKKKKENPNTDFMLFTEINSNFIIDLYVKCKTTKLLEDNTEKKSQLPRIQKWLFSYNAKDTIHERTKIDKLEFIKIKNYSVDDNFNRINWQAMLKKIAKGN